MGTHRFAVREVVPETPRAVVLRLDAGRDAVPFAAGQAAMVGLADRAGRKPYSIACSPEHSARSGVLEFLIEVSDGGQPGPHLANVRAGSCVAVEGPIGGFPLARMRRRRELLFVAGGTGIAPLRAMIGSALARPHPPAMTLIYSARAPEEFAFRRELAGLARRRQLRLCMTATREYDGLWRGRRGRIRQSWVDAFVEGRSPLCVVCGPEEFVVHLTGMLSAAGVPARDIRRE
jgi:ring-1,2-phenylacetyl-CoA epoxidase subunit PaaE